MAVGILDEFYLHILWQFRLHEALEHEISVLLLVEPLLEELDDFVLLVDGDLELGHVGIESSQVYSELVPVQVGPNYGLYDVVYDVTVDHRTDAHAGQGVGSCERVHGGDVSVADLANGVDSPVEGVEVLNSPPQFDDACPGRGAIEPADYVLYISYTHYCCLRRWDRPVG